MSLPHWHNPSSVVTNMPSLVEELQRDALDSKVEVTDLLRKAYVVATKLKLEKLKEWCQSELNGYSGRDVPVYRNLYGDVRAWNPFHGWIPVVFEDDESRRKLSNCPQTGPIAVIQDLLSRSVEKKDSSQFAAMIAPKIQKYLMRDDGLERSLHLSRGQLVGIVDAVRNAILEWSLKLEADGILGEGMSFSPSEKDLAVQHANELQSVVNYISIGTMTNSTLQQASPSAKQRTRG